MTRIRQRAKFDRDYIASIPTTSAGNVAFSERDRQLLLMAMTHVQERYNWNDMNDTQWDGVLSLVNSIQNKLLNY